MIIQILSFGATTKGGHVVAKFLVCVETINPKNNVCLEGCYQKLDVVTFPVSEEKEAKKRLDLLRSQGKLIRLYQLTEIPE